MAEQIWQNCKLWLAGYDLSGDMNALALDYGAELQDNTTFGATTRSRLGGLKTVAVQHEGLWNGGADQVDGVLFGRIGLKDEVMSMAPQAGAEGEIAYTFRSALSEYSPGAPVGEILGFSVSGESNAGDPLIKGTILHNAAQTATGNGGAFQLGVVGATQKLYAALHVVAISGTTPTLEVKVQSDNASGMATPTDRITFAQATAIGAQWATPVAGPLAPEPTDDWFRVAYTIDGTGPSFTFVVIIGIQ